MTLLLDRPGPLTPDLVVRVDDDASRRGFLTGGLSLAALLAAAGCAGEPSPAPEPTVTRTYVDATGAAVDIPSRPRRIAALHANQTGAPLLSIGAPVIASTYLSYGFLDDYDASGVTEIAPNDTLSIEALATAEPDLIIGFASKEVPDEEPSVVEQLAGIAPVVWVDTSAPLDDVMAAFGEITGLQEEVARQRTEWEALADRLRMSSPAGLSTAFVANYGDGSLAVYNATAPVAITGVLGILGIRTPPVASSTVERFASVSGERLQELSADVLIWDTAAEDPATLPLWAALPAVAAGQVGSMKAGNLCYASFVRTAEALRTLIADANSSLVDESSW